jgi:hypothetical protein
MIDSTKSQQCPKLRVAVLERRVRSSADVFCEIGANIQFSTEKLESYCLSEWESVIFDALLLAGAVEFCDRVQKRPARRWGRHFALTMAVHDPDRWNDESVVIPLKDSLDFLTGDRWEIRFVKRRSPVTPPRQGHFLMPTGTTAVIPFSDGLDSRAVAGLMMRDEGDRLIGFGLAAKPSTRRSRAQNSRLPRFPIGSGPRTSGLSRQAHDPEGSNSRWLAVSPRTSQQRTRS